MNLNPAAIEHRLAGFEAALRRRGFAAGARAAIEAERAEALMRAATDGELDALERAVADGDWLEEARLLGALERRVDGTADERAEKRPADVSPLASAVEAERARRGLALAGGDVERVLDLVAWLAGEEIEKLYRAVAAGLPLPGGRTLVPDPGARIVERVLERARRRRELGIGTSSRSLGQGRRVSGARCRRDVAGCACVADALDLEGWAELGRAGVRAVARRRHEALRVRRASGAARRRRARERRPEPLRAAAVEVAEVVEVEVDGSGGEVASDGDSVVVPLATRRRARLWRPTLPAPLSDAEAESLAGRLGLAALPVTQWHSRRGRRP